MSDREKCVILRSALRKVCKLIRDNPPGDLSEYPPGMIKLLAGGAERDPEGEEYVHFFLNQAITEYLTEQKERI